MSEVQSSSPSATRGSARQTLFDEPFLRKLERLAVLTNRAAAGNMQGERRSSKRGQSVEFADFRPYTLGDDFRRIDWNAYARLERFFIKLFVEEQDLVIHLLVDISQSMNWGDPNKLWYAQRAAAALGYVALAGLDRVTASALGPERSNGTSYFPPHRGKQQAFSLFTFLQNLSAKGHTPLGPRLKAYAAAAAQPGPLVLFSDLMDDGWSEGLSALASRGFEVSVVQILSPDEVEPEIAGDKKLIDSETQAEVEITAEYDLLQRYKDSLADWQAELHRFCSARGMHYAPIVTTLPFDELLFAWMRKQGILK